VKAGERLYVGMPVVALNNTIYGFKELPVRFIAASGAPTV